MNIDGFYYWTCDICKDSVSESPHEDDPWGYGNLLLIETSEGIKRVCRWCVDELGDEIRGKGVGFVYEGISYTGPRAREWANDIINSLLDGGDIEEGACGYPVMAFHYRVEDEAHYSSVVALAQAATKTCETGCAYEPDKCPVKYWAEKLEMPFDCQKVS
jgi:hypothetical protein